MLLTVWDCVAVVLAIFILYRFLSKRSEPSYPFPPGPPGKFLIGNAPDMPPENDPRVFHHWGKQYGGLVHLNVLGQHIAIITSQDIATELLASRSSIYSERPILTVSGENVGFSRTLVLSAYGSKYFREHRKFFSHRIGTAQKVGNYAAMQEQEANKFIKRVLSDPDQLQGNIHLTTASMLLRITYDHTADSMQDKLVVFSNSITELFSSLSAPGTFIADALPIFQHLPSWFPGARWKKSLPAWQKMMNDFVELPLKEVEAKLEKGQNVECLVAEHLTENVLTEEERHILAYSAGTMYTAGADTSFSAIYWFFRYMLFHPEVLKRAQEEIDTTLGFGRLPELNDRGSLPYVCAVMKEVLRLSEIAPNGVPHRLTQDDIYKGYFLPAGTLVMASIWSMLRDPVVYANPLEFNPDRFLGSSPEPDPTIIYGFGRRVCPGSVFADATVFLMIAKSIAAFNIERMVDEKGVPLDLPYAVEGGSIVKSPSHFPCKISSRLAKESV